MSCPCWPGYENGQPESNNITKILVIADPHIMGPYKSYSIDKLRREWQMHQSFRFSTSSLEPDVIVFLGDLLDEGYYSSSSRFDKSCLEFEDVFLDYSRTPAKRVVVVGNHDAGFHYDILENQRPLARFMSRFGTFDLISRLSKSELEYLNLLVVNSMLFYDESSPYHETSTLWLNKFALMLDAERKSQKSTFISPIIFKHMPLYRGDDSACTYPESLAHKAKTQNEEGVDVLHRRATNLLLTKLKPRLVVSGHTHAKCSLQHKVDFGSASTGHDWKFVKELTVPSYNHKYAEYKPGYLLLTVTPTDIYTKNCDMIDEMPILLVYSSMIVITITRFWTLYRR